MRVYRLETEAGEGVFFSDLDYFYDSNHRCRNREHSARDLPPPCMDEALDERWKKLGYYKQQNYRFAFASIKQMKKFFPSKKGRKALAEAGVILSTYEAKDYIKGEHQVVFKKKTSKLVEKHHDF